MCLSGLPVTKKEYENSVLVADFIRKIRNVFDADDRITEFRFAPRINGYEITYTVNGKPETVSIKFRKISDGIDINLSGNVEKKTFCSRTFEENSAVLQKIFETV